ncbi:MAG: cupin domain-containing protein [Acidobacteria bacterium]|nr:cupin domain-containing protein [Acidobacteriota bacterium]
MPGKARAGHASVKESPALLRVWAGFQRVQPALHKGVRPRHTREDEYSYVLAGQVGALLGDEVLIARPGDLVFKPRNQWHTFWNAGDEPARILEIIAPAGFEKFFAELVDLGGVSNTSPALFADLCGRYGLDMDPSSVPGLVERFGVRFPGGTALEKPCGRRRNRQGCCRRSRT